MRYLIGLLVLVVSLPAYAEQKAASIEEQVLMETFIGYQSALVFDEVCNKNDPKSRYDFEKPENVNLMGNQQMLAARIGGLQHLRFPEASVDDLVKKLVATSAAIESKIAEKVRSDGCESRAGKAAGEAYKLFSQAHPAQVFGLIDKKIVEKGGTVTPASEIENSQP